MAASTVKANLSLEQDWGEYLASLPPEQRRDAQDRVDARVSLQAPADSVDPPPLKVSTLRELHAEPAVPLQGLWGRWLIRGEMASIAARGGVGKTAFTRNLMLRSARGGAFMGESFERPLSWLYFTREGSGSFFRLKTERLAAALDLEGDALDRIRVVDQANDCGLMLSRAKDLDDIRRTLDEVKGGSGLDVVVFDPFTRFKDGSENDDKDMAAAVDAILALQAEFDIASWVPHHASQSGTGKDAWRGHTTFEGGMATGFLLTDKVGTDPNPCARRLEVAKCRYSFALEDLDTRYFDGDPATEVYAEREGTGTESRIREALKRDGDWHTYADLSEATGAARSTVQEHVKRFADRGDVERDNGGDNGAARVRWVSSLGIG
jgi:RecA-family ATPase